MYTITQIRRHKSYEKNMTEVDFAFCIILPLPHFKYFGFLLVFTIFSH